MELITDLTNIGEIIFSDSFETVADGDLIVPDVKPDILKVVQVNATACISSKEISDGRLTVSGRTDLTVLYLPDRDSGGVESIHTSFDFVHRLDRAVINSDCYALVGCDITKADFHVINSRKLSLKAVVSIDCEIISSKEVQLLTGIGEENVKSKTEPVEVTTLSCIRDSDFVIKDVIEIPSGKASVKEILNIDYKICEKEIKLLTDKAIVKGTLAVCVLYTDTSDNVEYTGAELPFTEIFDLPEANEDDSCDLNFRTCDCYFDVGEDNDGDKRIINLEISVCAEIKVSSRRSIDVITDCFCPGYETQVTYSDFNINEAPQIPAIKNTLRETVLIENGPKIEKVYNVITKVFITRTQLQNDKLSVEGKLVAYILYISDNPPTYSYKKEIPFSYLLDCPGAREGMACSITADAEHTDFHLNSANEVEIRCIVNICANVFTTRTISLITDVEISEIPKDKKKGIVIYFVQPGDTLWQIAKNYYVSVEDIADFNQLADKNKLIVGQRLLIPSVSGCKG